MARRDRDGNYGFLVVSYYFSTFIVAGLLYLVPGWGPVLAAVVLVAAFGVERRMARRLVPARARVRR